MLVHLRTPRALGGGLAAAGVLLSLAPAALAAAPTQISERTIDSHPSTLAFDAAGNAVASWRGVNGRAPDAVLPFVRWARRSPDGLWHAGPALPSTVLAHDIAVSPAGRVALVTLRETPLRNKRSRSTMVLNVSDAASLTPSRPIRLDTGPVTRVSSEGPSPTLGLPEVAMAADGEIVVTWQRGYPRANAGVWVAVRRPNGRIVKARRLAENGGTPALTIAADGSGFVAWARGHRLLSRRRSANRWWGPVETIYTHPAEQWAMLESLGVATAGRTLVATTLITVRSAKGVKIRVSSHTRIPSGRWRTGVLGVYTFNTTAQTSYVTSQPRALPIVTSDGTARVLWPAMTGGHVGAAITQLYPERDGVRTGPATVLSDPAVDVLIEGASAGLDGRFGVTWFDTAGRTGSPVLAEGDASGSYVVHPRPVTEPALFGTQVAYDPLTGRPLCSGVRAPSLRATAR